MLLNQYQHNMTTGTLKLEPILAFCRRTCRSWGTRHKRQKPWRRGDTANRSLQIESDRIWLKITTQLEGPHSLLACQVDLPEPEDEDAGGKKGSVLNSRKEDKQLMELAGRTMNHAQR